MSSEIYDMNYMIAVDGSIHSENLIRFLSALSILQKQVYYVTHRSPEFKDSLNTSLLKRNLRCHGFVTDGQKKFLFQLAQLCLLKKEQANITRFLVVAFEDTHTLLITQKLQNPSNHSIYFTESQLTRY